jgi:anti-anti-sigma regulatory factor
VPCAEIGQHLVEPLALRPRANERDGLVWAAHASGPDAAAAAPGHPVSLPVCETIHPRISRARNYSHVLTATDARLQLVDTPMRIVCPALMMVTHTQTHRTVENGGTGMVPRSILLVLTDDARADSAPADRGRRNAAVAAISWLFPLPRRNAGRPPPPRAAPGREVRAIPLTGEDGTVHVRRGWSGAIIELLGEHDLATAATVEDRLGDALAGGSVVVDLSAAALIDCSILRVLSRAADMNVAHGMVVCAPPGTFPRRLIDIASSSTDLDLAVYDTRDQALCAAAMWPT